MTSSSLFEATASGDGSDFDASSRATVAGLPKYGTKVYTAWLSNADPAVVANALICLIHQANYLLDRQIAGLERAFIHEGGYSERFAAARLAERARQRGIDPEETAPACPSCGKRMELRTARKGARAGSRFWGCAGYPDCKGTRPFEAVSESDRSVGSV